MIVTFYSYKGGVGRSMALANVGTRLYQKGHRVLLVDWDLEAPGLESFFVEKGEPLSEIQAKSGLIDLVESYKQLWNSVQVPGGDDWDEKSRATKILQEIGGIQHLLLPLDKTNIDTISTRRPGLWLLPAGCRAGDSEQFYTKTVNAMDWGSFYDEFGGFYFIEWLIRQFEKDVDVVLIDSRTGITEMGGVCTQHLADIAMLLFAPNFSNLRGIKKITDILISDTLKKLRGSGRPITIFPIPARVDTQGATNKLEDFENQFRKEFGKYEQIDVDWCWKSKIPYVTNYSYEEQVLFLNKSGHSGMKEAYERLGNQIALLREEENLLTDYSSLGAGGISLKHQEGKNVDIESSRQKVQDITKTASEEISQGNYSIAEDLLRSGLTLITRDLGEENPETLRVKSLLAKVLNFQGRFESAKELWEELVIIHRRIQGKKDPLTLAAMANLAVSLRDLGDFGGAQKIFEQLVFMHRSVFGEEHPETLSSMNSLSEVLSAAGNLEAAKQLQEQVVQNRSEILGEEHPETLISMSNLSDTFSALGNLEEARIIQERVLKARTRILGEEHPDTILSNRNLGSILRAEGKRAEARLLERPTYKYRTSKPIVYVSSTYEDLQEHRKAVFQALRKGGYEVLAMEEYIAADERPVDACLANVNKADIYVGLFGFRYGYVPPEEHGNAQQLSITELEYQEAKKSQKPCLTFVAEEDAGFLPKYMDAYTGDGEQGNSIKRLRHSLLTEQMAEKFSTPYELASKVLAAVVKVQERSGAKSGIERAQPDSSFSGITWDIARMGSPYPGLLHFTRKYAPVFFGREIEIQEILERFHAPEGRFLIISGDSGVGKSSLVDAGLLPRLESTEWATSPTCYSVRMVPSQRQQPMEAFIEALSSLITQAGLSSDLVLQNLCNAPETLGATINTIMERGGTSGQTLVLFLDQMEELFAAQDLMQTYQFLSILFRATRNNILKVIGTIRSDHLNFCHRHPDMLSILNSSGHYERWSPNFGQLDK